MSPAGSAHGRGGGWVAAQFVVMGLIVAAAATTPGWPDAWRRFLLAVGLVLAPAGIAVAVWSGRTLGRSLTPFPRPASQGTLVERGPYAVVRHPIYAAGLLVFAGLGLATGPVALALTGVLAVLWALKLRVEERHLAARYPAYAAYCRRVRWRLVPGVY